VWSIVPNYIYKILYTQFCNYHVECAGNISSCLILRFDVYVLLNWFFHDQRVNEWSMKLSWINHICQLPCNRVKHTMFIFWKTNRTYLWRFHSAGNIFICFGKIRDWTYHLVCLSACFGVGCVTGEMAACPLSLRRYLHRILFSANSSYAFGEDGGVKELLQA
jgi:hypothetical protein